MDADEMAVLSYLRGADGEYIAEREILRRADGKRRFEESPHWAVHAFVSLLEKGAIESDGRGHYRVRKTANVATAGELEKQPAPRWISPQIKAILERSGKDFSHPEKPDEEKKS